jgi:hypothetical protein
MTEILLGKGVKQTNKQTNKQTDIKSIPIKSASFWLKVLHSY